MMNLTDGKKGLKSTKNGLYLTESTLLRQERSLTFVILNIFGVKPLSNLLSKHKIERISCISIMKVGTENTMSTCILTLIEWPLLDFTAIGRISLSIEWWTTSRTEGDLFRWCTLWCSRMQLRVNDLKTMKGGWLIMCTCKMKTMMIKWMMNANLKLIKLKWLKLIMFKMINPNQFRKMSKTYSH
jgi:hypothetical protein